MFVSALVGYLISYVISLAISGLGSLGPFGEELPSLAGGSLLYLFCCLPFAGILTVISLIIYAALTQFIARILGGKGTFSDLVYVFGAYTAPFTLLTVVLYSIPFLNFCLGLPVAIYGLVLSTTAVNAVNKFGWAKSVASVLIVPIGLALISACLVIGLLALLGPVIGNVFSDIVRELSTPVP